MIAALQTHGNCFSAIWTTDKHFIASQQWNISKSKCWPSNSHVQHLRAKDPLKVWTSHCPFTELNDWVLAPINQSRSAWPSCSWHWNCYQGCQPKSWRNSNHFGLNQRSRTQVNLGKISFWCETKSWKDFDPRWSGTSITDDQYTYSHKQKVINQKVAATYLGLVNYCNSYIQWFSEKLTLFVLSLKNADTTVDTQELTQAFRELNTRFENCQTAPKSLWRTSQRYSWRIPASMQHGMSFTRRKNLKKKLKSKCKNLLSLAIGPNTLHKTCVNQLKESMQNGSVQYT